MAGHVRCSRCRAILLAGTRAASPVTSPLLPFAGRPPPAPPPNHPHPPPPTTTTGRGRPHAAGGGASGASWVLACGARVRRSNQVGGQAEGFYVGGGAGSRSAGRGGRVRGEGCTGRGELEGEADVRRRSTLVVLLAQVEGPVEGRAGGLRVQCQCCLLALRSPLLCRSPALSHPPTLETACVMQGAGEGEAYRLCHRWWWWCGWVGGGLEVGWGVGVGPTEQ